MTTFVINKPDLESDLNRIIEMVNSAYAAQNRKFGVVFKRPNRYHGKEGRLEAEEDLHHMLVAREGADGGEIVGCVRVSVKDDVAFIGPLAVDPRWQRRGAGRLLLDRAEDLAPTSEIKVVSCVVDILRMYERRGYTCVEAVPAVDIDEGRSFGNDIRILTMRKTRK